MGLSRLGELLKEPGVGPSGRSPLLSGGPHPRLPTA